MFTCVDASETHSEHWQRRSVQESCEHLAWNAFASLKEDFFVDPPTRLACDTETSSTRAVTQTGTTTLLCSAAMFFNAITMCWIMDEIWTKIKKQITN